jgi:hypothetical protein
LKSAKVFINADSGCVNMEGMKAKRGGRCLAITTANENIRNKRASALPFHCCGPPVNYISVEVINLL